jgi:cytochrome c
MKYRTLKLIGIVFFAAAIWQPALADEALLKNKGCTACHGMENKIVGPPIKDIAAKYKGDDAAPAALAAKVKNGGSGVWGQVPMPPNAAVSDEDISKLVAWMLSQ